MSLYGDYLLLNRHCINFKNQYLLYFNHTAYKDILCIDHTKHFPLLSTTFKSIAPCQEHGRISYFLATSPQGSPHHNFDTVGVLCHRF